MINVIESSRPGYELINKLKEESVKLKSYWGDQILNKLMKAYPEKHFLFLSKWKDCFKKY